MSMMIAKDKTDKTRPYWHVDFKWINAIALFFGLGAALLLYNLSYLTERDRAIDLSATIVASMFSRDGMDDEKSLTEFRQKATLIPGDTVSPITQFPWLTISKSDLMTLNAHELRLKIFSQLTGPIYDHGIDGAARRLTPNPAEQATFKKDAALLAVFTRTTHEVLRTGLYIALAITAVSLVGVVYFSRRWGRLASPGVVFFMVSPIGAVAGLLLRNPPKNGDAPLAKLPGSVAETIGTGLTHSYLFLAAAGVVLLLIALTGKIIQSVVRRRSNP